MKKEYINPEMEVVKIETQQIIAASIGVGTDLVSPGSADGRLFDDFEDLDDINAILGGDVSSLMK